MHAFAVFCLILFAGFGGVFAAPAESFQVVEFSSGGGITPLHYAQVYLDADGRAQTSARTGEIVSEIREATVSDATLIGQWRAWVKGLKAAPSPAQQGIAEGFDALTEVTHLQADGQVRVWRGPHDALPAEFRASIVTLRTSARPVPAKAGQWLVAYLLDDVSATAQRQADALLKRTPAQLAACPPALEALDHPGLLVPVNEPAVFTQFAGRILSENQPAVSLGHQGRVFQLRLGFTR